MINSKNHSASFRDPSGYVFVEDGILKRRINPIYFSQYYYLKDNKLFKKLFDTGSLIRHEEISADENEIILKPEHIPFITYPYEWSFEQYKEAALLTLRIHKFCLDNDLILKDASAFNVTFHEGKAIFIDTLSFDFYRENKPWRAYKQFVTHFLGPLLLARYNGSQCLQLMSRFMDGIPVKVLSSMLPFKTKFNATIYSNIHLLAKFEDKHNEDYNGETKDSEVSKKGQLNIIKNLYNFIGNLSLKEESEWGDYYNKTNYSEKALITKTNLINSWIKKINAKTAIDIGGNDGTFVRKIEQKIERALVCDVDNSAVDFNFIKTKLNTERHITPFVLDVLNPSPSIGFNSKERDSFLKRIKIFKPDVTMALALIHHMSLSGNIPFALSAEFFASFSTYLVIEFPKREDSWVKRLLNAKGEFKSHFDYYNLEHFEESYSQFFDIVNKEKLKDSDRFLYLLKIKK